MGFRSTCPVTLRVSLLGDTNFGCRYCFQTWYMDVPTRSFVYKVGHLAVHQFLDDEFSTLIIELTAAAYYIYPTTTQPLSHYPRCLLHTSSTTMNKFEQYILLHTSHPQNRHARPTTAHSLDHHIPLRRLHAAQLLRTVKQRITLTTTYSHHYHKHV